jgi:hypothetical protein
MTNEPTCPAEPQESELLVSFESANIPGPYKEYYKIRRNNFFASIQGFPEMWEYYIRLDNIWLREFGDLRPLREANLLFPLILYFNAHAKMRISVELALSGCLAEARSILRDTIEFVAHAHSMIGDPRLQKVWLSKNEEEDAFRKTFERGKKVGLFKGLDELYAKWGELSEFGSHATLNSICDRFTIVETRDGGREWRLRYCGVDQGLWATSLFSMLLTCFVMERTFFGDYEDRLKLDNELMRIRGAFESYKEGLRQMLIKRYGVEPQRGLYPPPAARIYRP